MSNMNTHSVLLKLHLNIYFSTRATLENQNVCETIDSFFSSHKYYSIMNNKGPSSNGPSLPSDQIIPSKK